MIKSLFLLLWSLFQLLAIFAAIILTIALFRKAIFRKKNARGGLYCYIGNRGGSKTYSMVEKIAAVLTQRTPRNVATTVFDLNIPAKWKNKVVLVDPELNVREINRIFSSGGGHLLIFPMEWSEDKILWY